MKTFDETYMARSTFFRLLGEAGKTLAEAYTVADLDNQASIKEMAFEAMSHALVEFHGYSPEDIHPQVIDYIASGMAARVGM